MELSEYGFEYLDHTADVQVHAWGLTLPQTFECAAQATMNYMSDIQLVEEIQSKDITAEGHDMESLLYNFLDEVLCVFVTEPYMICSRFTVTKLDKENFSINATCYGELFDLKKHSQGTEIKAITYSNLQIKYVDDTYHAFVIVDI